MLKIKMSFNKGSITIVIVRSLYLLSTQRTCIEFKIVNLEMSAFTQITCLHNN